MPRYILQYSKKGPARYIAHLDMMRLFERAIRRAGLPVSFSGGFNPHPRISIAAPLPVGTEGLAEMAELEMTEPVAEKELIERLNASMPPGIQIRKVSRVPGDAPAIMSILDRASYIVHIDGEDLPSPPPAGALQQFLARDTVEITRRGKDGKIKKRDIRPGIIKMEVLPGGSGLTMRLVLKTGSSMNVRPVEAVSAFLEYTGLKVDPADILVTRTALHFAG